MNNDPLLQSLQPFIDELRKQLLEEVDKKVAFHVNKLADGIEDQVKTTRMSQSQISPPAVPPIPPQSTVLSPSEILRRLKPRHD